MSLSRTLFDRLRPARLGNSTGRVSLRERFSALIQTECAHTLDAQQPEKGAPVAAPSEHRAAHAPRFRLRFAGGSSEASAALFTTSAAAALAEESGEDSRPAKGSPFQDGDIWRSRADCGDVLYAFSGLFLGLNRAHLVGQIILADGADPLPGINLRWKPTAGGSRIAARLRFELVTENPFDALAFVARPTRIDLSNSLLARLVLHTHPRKGHKRPGTAPSRKE